MIFCIYMSHHHMTIFGKLKEKGHRLTDARKAIVQTFTKSQKPLGALDLHNVLRKKGLETNQVTVYRELAFLEKEGILHSVKFNDGIRRYEMQSDSHKHHLICLKCKGVDHMEMEGDLTGLEKKIGKEKSFKVQSHALEFYGLCAGCA